MKWGMAPAGGGGGSKDSIKEGKALGGGSRRLVHKIGSRGGRGRGKKGLHVTLLLLGVGAGEAEGRSFESNASKSDTAPLLALVGSCLALSYCTRVAEEGSVGDIALASWNPTLVEVGCCPWGGRRSKLYGYGSPLRMKVINLKGEMSIQLKVETQFSGVRTRPSIVSDNGSCCFESETKNQNMTVYGPLSCF